MSNQTPIAPGLCGCGCGNPTKIATETRRKDGHIKGQPLRFIHLHYPTGERHPLWIKPPDVDHLPLCQCGCGAQVKPWNSKSRHARFIHGHNGRAENNTKWKGGRFVRDGYVRVRLPTHPRADSKGYVREHVLIAEKAIGKLLPLGAIVHHVNEIRNDNRNNNLVICQDQTYHLLLHVRMDALKACGNPNSRKCRYCHKYDEPERVRVQPDGKAWGHPDCCNTYRRALWHAKKQAITQHVSPVD